MTEKQQAAIKYQGYSDTDNTPRCGNCTYCQDDDGLCWCCESTEVGEPFKVNKKNGWCPLHIREFVE